MNAAFRITAAGNMQVTKDTAYVYAILIACTTAGQVLKIRNGETPDPKILVPPYTLEVEPSTAQKPLNPRYFEWLQAPKLMKNGIIINTTGTGEVTVWIDYRTADIT